MLRRGVGEDHPHACRRLDRGDDVRPTPYAFEPCVDHRIDRDIDRTRHLRCAGPSEVVDQVRGWRRLNGLDTLQSPRTGQALTASGSITAEVSSALGQVRNFSRLDILLLVVVLFFMTVKPGT
jgi:hypothetical protein